jgi:hypothetical protein
MRLRTPSRTFVVVGVAAAVVLGGAAVAQAAPSTARGPVLIHGTETRSVSAPAAIRPGLVQLHNTGRMDIAIFKKKHAGITRLVHDLGGGGGSGASGGGSSSGSGGGSAAPAVARAGARAGSKPNPLLRDFSLVTTVAAKSSAYVQLGRGTYFLLGDELMQPRAADIRTLTVTGPVANSRPAAARGQLIVEKTGVLQVSRAAMPRGAWLHIHNGAGTVRGFFLLAVAKSATSAEIAAFLARPTARRAAPIVQVRSLSDVRTLIVGANRNLWTNLPLHAGRWLIATGSLATLSGPGFTAHHVGLLTVR